MNIETNFWGLVGVVGLVLTIPLNIASNLLTPRVINYLERRKIIKSHRSKEQELANYKRVDAFKNGTIYILLATATVICSAPGAENSAVIRTNCNIGDNGDTYYRISYELYDGTDRLEASLDFHSSGKIEKSLTAGTGDLIGISFR